MPDVAPVIRTCLWGKGMLVFSGLGGGFAGGLSLGWYDGGQRADLGFYLIVSCASGVRGQRDADSLKCGGIILISLVSESFYPSYTLLSIVGFEGLRGDICAITGSN